MTRVLYIFTAIGISCGLLILARPSEARVVQETISQRVSGSKVVLVGKVLNSNATKLESLTSDDESRIFPHKFEIKPVRVLKGEIGKKNLSIEYNFQLNVKPRVKLFHDGEKVIFFLSKVVGTKGVVLTKTFPI